MPDLTSDQAGVAIAFLQPSTMDGAKSVPGVSFGNVWDGSWHHLVFVVNNTIDKLYAYTDGVLHQSTTNTVTANASSTGAIVIGNSYNFSRGFSGTIDEVIIYKRALSEQEVADLFNSYQAPPDTTPPTTPQDLTAAVVSETQIDITWQAASDPESGINHYSIYRDNAGIGQSSTTSFSDNNLTQGTTYTYEVSAVNNAGLESEKSSPINATTLEDTIPPTILSVSATETTVSVNYDEPVDNSSATDINNYNVDNGITVLSASLGGNQKTVTLATSPHTEGINYNLTVTNVNDVAGNTISPTTTTYIAGLIDPSLIAYWKFEQDAGDETGVNNGTLVGAIIINDVERGNVLSLDGINDYVTIHSLNDWFRYAENPITPNGQTWVSVLKDGSEYKMYYSVAGSLAYIGLKISSDGKSWTDYGLVLSRGSSGEWDRQIWVPMVWKEGGIYHMMYTGKNRVLQIGHATSSNGINWVKDSSNPVFNCPAGTWCHDYTESFGVMKVSNTYYMWVSNLGGGKRQSGVATSTDLVNWNLYQTNPIFSGDRFCGAPFKYNGDYYFLIPHYTSGTDYSQIELYKSPDPYFLPSNREFVKIAINYGESGKWDSHDQDTPFVLTDDIYRNSFNASNNELWAYYAGENGGVWKTGLTIETDIEAALKKEDAPLGLINTDFSIAAWINANNLNELKCIIGNDHHVTGGGWGFWASYPAFSDNLGIYIQNGFRTSNSGVFTAGSWYHVAFVFNNADNTGSFYVNGVDVGNVSGLSEVGISTHNTLIGIDPRDASGYAFDGKIDDIRIYNRALSEQELMELFNNY